MDENSVKRIIEEVREEYRIPPYYSDDSLKSHINTGVQTLLQIVDEINFDDDQVARSFLKNYVLYAYFQKADEFRINFNADLVAWQMDRL